MASIALGLTALIFLWGFNDGVHNSMMRNLQEVIVGSVQIHAVDFFRHPKLNRTVPGLVKVEDILKQLNVSRYTLRLRTFALAAGENNSEGLILLGIDPVREARVTRLHQKVSQGRFIADRDTLTCVMGATTARNLGLAVGDDVVLLAEDRYGSLAADKFRLVGIIESGEMGIDRGLAIVSIRSLDSMLGMQGKVSEVVIQTTMRRLESVTSQMKTMLGGRYEVLRWYDMYPMMKQWVELENAFYYIFLTVVLIIVAAGVMNTVLMSTLERFHEFGIMMALGCRRWQLAMLVAVESLMLGLMGTVLGVAAGLFLVTIFHNIGIDLSGQMDTISRFYINPVIHTEIDSDHLLTTVLAVIASAALASVVPAVRAARLEPVEAIRHV